MINGMAETPYEFLTELQRERDCKRREVWKRDKRVQLKVPEYGTEVGSCLGCFIERERARTCHLRGERPPARPGEWAYAFMLKAKRWRSGGAE